MRIKLNRSTSSVSPGEVDALCAATDAPALLARGKIDGIGVSPHFSFAGEFGAVEPRAGAVVDHVGALAVIGIVYGALVAMVQPDMKKLVAYSSVAHMGFVTLGFFMFNNLGISGGLVQMIAHGFVSGAMFLCIGVLYDRVHSREIADYGGVVNTMPKFAAFAVFFGMANCGLPATAGFVGEWMVILGTVKANFGLRVVAGVPEPTTAMLSLVGLAGLLAFGRARR